MFKKLKSFWHYNFGCRISKDEMILRQNAKIKYVVKHAYESTQFYRRWMDEAGVKPEHINCAIDLQKIPPVAKSQIQMDYTSFLSNRYKPEDCEIRTTSGSSGKILRLFWDKENFWTRIVTFYRTAAMIGYNPFKKVAIFLPVTEDPGFNFGLFRQKGISLSNSFEKIREMLLEYKPHIMSIYPSFAIDLGKHLSDRDIEQMGVEAISLNSEIILPHDVAIIEKKYKCPAYEEYSSMEMGLTASMCKEKGMHIFLDNVVLEILDDEGNPLPNGESGEVVLTSLSSFAMPFIRYRIGDYSTILKEECPCGRPFPLLGSLEGRKDDYFIMKDGSKIPAWKIYEVVERPLEEYGMEKLVLADFHLIQKEHTLAEFYYVKGPHFQNSYIQVLREGSKKLFGDEFNLIITETSDIERVKSEKRKYIQCGLKKTD